MSAKDLADLAVAVEEYMDEYGLAALLYMIAEICVEKAEHIEANYQDRALTKAWESAGNRIDRLAATSTISDL